MTHWSKATGITAVVGMYLIQASFLLWGPPPLKAFAGLWIVTPGMDPLMFAFGYWVGSGIGHGDDSPSRMDVFTGLLDEFDYDECNPFHPDWARRCIF